jgi:hypothetical protein
MGVVNPSRRQSPNRCRILPRVTGLLALSLLAGCYYFSPKPVGIGPEVDWDDLPGWHQDSHAEAWPALLQRRTVKRKGATHKRLYETLVDR